jgi:hypothetical protein
MTLDLTKTKVSVEGVQKLQKELSRCAILSDYTKP